MDNIVLLIGESCTDIFIYGDTPRLSPEGPAPVFQPKREVYNGGMVLNVESNLSTLGIESDVITQVNSITKTRYVNDTFNTLLLRVDENDYATRIDNSLLNRDFWKYAMIVISDYNKGFLTEDDIAYIAYKHPNTICDTKKKLGEWCKDLKFIKLNRTEYQNNLEFIQNNNWILEKLIITLDKDGCRYMNKMYPTEQVEIMDISGAGDTFVAGFVKKYLDTDDIPQSIIFGNKCSSQVVQKRGVGAVEFENLK
jgi:D-beta-D-heptose 7-phosphate kinase/D-beta-D-heptose 1-phosphate adenosyltransferase